MTVSFTINNKSIFYKFIVSLQKISMKVKKTNNILFKFNENGVFIEFYDLNDTIGIVGKINILENYICKEEYFIEFNLLEFINNIKLLKKNIKITMLETLILLENENGNITMETEITQNFVERNYDNVVYDKFIKVNSNDFYTQMTNLTKLCSRITFNISDKIYLNLQNTKLIIDGESNITENIESTFYIDKLKIFSNGKFFIQECLIFIKKDYPIILQYAVDENNFIKCIGSPYIPEIF